MTIILCAAFGGKNINERDKINNKIGIFHWIFSLVCENGNYYAS